MTGRRSDTRAPAGAAEARTFVALLRGINVGGRGRLPMAGLRAILEEIGAEDVRTYLQSGNAVFRGRAGAPADLAAEIGAAIRARHGFAPHVLVLGLPELDAAIRGNPFAQAEREPQSLHVFFLDAAPARPDLGALERLRSGAERYSLAGHLLYLHAPDGFGRSKLAARAEQALGTPATARNWRTVCAIRELAES
jgi:uncharacterized protein (DUF1697 family)